MDGFCDKDLHCRTVSKELACLFPSPEKKMVNSNFATLAYKYEGAIQLWLNV